MTEPRIGSLFSGMGGLDMGVQAVLGGHVAWTCEVHPAASNILARHWPEVPNLGDVTKADWPSVEPIDVLVGGFPCQDISNAGLRAGIHGGRSGLWTHMLNAIEWLDPKLVVIENVSALRSARSEFSEEVRVPGPRGGARLARTHRALGVVLADLAWLGYDARWGSVRAADVGAPHRRERVFVLAYPGVTGLEGLGPAESQRWDGAADSDREPVALLPSPHANATTGPGRQGRDGGMNLQTAVALLDDAFGQYAPAIARWEQILGRPAPSPTRDDRLSPVFVEWMMGLPEGHVTDVGLSKTQQLKILGNGVVPQQAALALELLLVGVPC